MRYVLLALMLGCGGTTADLDASATLSGTLTKFDGGCMPQMPPTCVVSHTTVAAVPVAKTTTDSNGHYSLHAPPGRWSVFVEDDGVLYANSHDSTDDAIDPVNLSAGVETRHDITINRATW